MMAMMAAAAGNGSAGREVGQCRTGTCQHSPATGIKRLQGFAMGNHAMGMSKGSGKGLCEPQSIIGLYLVLHYIALCWSPSGLHRKSAPCKACPAKLRAPRGVTATTTPRARVDGAALP